MGNSCCSVAQPDTVAAKPAKAPWSFARNKRKPGEGRGELNRDPAHYKATNLEDQVVVRLPQTLNDQQFTLDKCTRCKIVLLDQLDSVVGDDCVDCVVIIGPTSGSVFLRNFKNCIVIAACGQMRLRDCSRCDLLLYCQSKPVIEASKEIRFGCYRYYYFELQSQFDLAKLSVYNNHFDEVHDFTKAHGGGMTQHWSILPDGTTARSLGVPPLSSLVGPDFPDGEETAAGTAPPFVVPTLLRTAKAGGDGRLTFVFFPPDCAVHVMTFLTLATGKLDVLDSRETPLFSEANVKKLKVLVKDSKGLGHLSKEVLLSGPCIGLLLRGEASVAAVWPESASSPVTVVEGEKVQAVSNFFFREVQEGEDGAGFGNSLKQ